MQLAAQGIGRRAQLAALLRALPRCFRRRTPRSADAPLRLRFVYTQLGAPTRYRVQHQMEQAALAGLEVQATPLDALAHLYDLTNCDLLYLHRLPLTSYTWPLYAAARQQRIPIIFDSDDLVWDQAERQYNYLDDHYPPRVVAALLKETRRQRAMMRLANAFVFATPYLAQQAARHFRQPAYVHANALSQAMVADSQAAYSQRRARPASSRVTMGYFSGTPRVHDEDMASIAPALCVVLDRYPEAHLRIYGDLTLRGALATPAYAARIERHQAVDWHALCWHIANVDINIAPLIDNPQRRAKSPVKYLEAALVGVPTVAAHLDPYQSAIVEGDTGYLAQTEAAWIDALSRLIQSPQLRLRLGEAARAQALASHTSASSASHFAAILEQVAAAGR